jgi:hypothetical protein
MCTVIPQHAPSRSPINNERASRCTDKSCTSPYPLYLYPVLTLSKKSYHHVLLHLRLLICCAGFIEAIGSTGFKAKRLIPQDDSETLVFQTPLVQRVLGTRYLE